MFDPKTGFGHYTWKDPHKSVEVVEASEVGFPPGVWPDRVFVKHGEARIVFWRSHQLTDSAGYSYSSPTTGFVLDILSD